MEIIIVCWWLLAKIATGLTGRWSSASLWGKELRVTVQKKNTDFFSVFLPPVQQQVDGLRLAETITHTRVVAFLHPPQLSSIQYSHKYMDHKQFCSTTVTFFSLLLQKPRPKIRGHTTAAQMNSVVQVWAILQNTHPGKAIAPRDWREDDTR